MSKKIKERTKQLAAREKELKENLLGKSGGSSKSNKIAKTALVGGVATLILYIIYKSFFQDGKKSKKRKKTKATSAVITEKLIAFALPYLAELLSSFLSKTQESKKAPEEDEEKKEVD